jgi:acyl-CoA-binding protein
MDQRGRAKYSSWSQFEGMSAQQAMTGYCMLVDDLTTAGKFETAPVSPASSTNAD